MDGLPAQSICVEEKNGDKFLPLSLKRKVRAKKFEFVGWGSKQLFEFLESIGKDITNQISQYDVSDVITKYATDNNLINPSKKKRINCDQKLYALFGRKTIGRIKVHDLLEPHYADNQDESEDDFLSSSEDEQKKVSNSERKSQPKKKLMETPKSCFAAIVPHNIKLLYLKRSLVEDLLKESGSFEGKVVGSFVRIKSDPNDYLQKNPYMLVHVTGLRKTSGTDDTFLHVSNYIRDVRISMLSDDNFSPEECEDLHHRVKDGLLKRPTVVELEEKAQTLHEDVTKHWLAGELVLLKKLIGRANEKGWRRELFDYLERKELLETPAEQSRLLHKIPEVIAEELEPKVVPQVIPKVTSNELEFNAGPPEIPEATAVDIKLDVTPHKVQHYEEQRNNDSAISTLQETITCEISTCNIASQETLLCWPSFGKDYAGIQASFKAPVQNHTDNKPEEVPLLNELTQQAELMTSYIAKPEPLRATTTTNESSCMLLTEVIDLSDDDEDDDNENKEGNDQILLNEVKCNDINFVYEIYDDEENDVETPLWYYADPEGNTQGPFALAMLKHWMDDDYFPPEFMVWKTGESQGQASLLKDIVQRMFRL